MTDATRILVVDDDPKIRTVVRRGLAYEGYRVVEAGSGEEGLEKAREHLPDLVILDLMMPGIDGLEVVRRLRKDRPALAAFLVTGFADPTLSARATDLGIIGMATKPFDDPRPLVKQIQEEAEAAMTRTREHGYLQRIKARHDRVLTQYRLLLSGLG